MTALYAAVDMHTLDETPGRPAPKQTDALDSLGCIERLLMKGANPNARLTATVLERGAQQRRPGAWRRRDAADACGPEGRRRRGASPARARRGSRGGHEGGVTALMIASGFGGQVRFAEYNPHSGTEREAAECVQLALDRGADVNEANDAGQTALHVAAAQRGEEFIRFLVARGARLDAKDKQGRTPLDVALGLGGRGRGRSPGAREAVAAVLRELSKS